MKKTMIIAASLLMAFSVPAFAAEQVKAEPGHGQMCPMMDKEKMAAHHKALIEQRVKEGKITAEQAKLMEETMAQLMGEMMKDMKCDMMQAHGTMDGMQGADHANHGKTTAPHDSKHAAH